MTGIESAGRRRFIASAAGGMLALSAGCVGRSSSLPGPQPRWQAVQPVLSLAAQQIRVDVAEGGAMRVVAGRQDFLLYSHLSFPGAAIGWNALSVSGPRAWRVRVRAAGDGSAVITGESPWYSLERTLHVARGQVLVTDVLTNITAEDVAVIVRHDAQVKGGADAVLFAGVDEAALIGEHKYAAKQLLRGAGLYPPYRVETVAENPTVFLKARDGGLGVVAEDTLSRLQFETGPAGDGAAWGHRHMALRPGTARELRWRVYALERDNGYFDFVNRVRTDWGTNFTLDGPWAFFDVTRHARLLAEASKLQKYVDGHYARVVAFKPWVDYDNFNWMTGKRTTRQEYVVQARAARLALRAADERTRCLGCVQHNLALLPGEVGRALYEARSGEVQGAGIYRFNERQTEIFVKALPGMTGVPRDSLVVDRGGHASYELYLDGPAKVPEIAVAAYPAVGNQQAALLLERVRFVLDTAQLDGVYVDQFNLAFPASSEQRYSHDRWDGVTVDIDERPGRIEHRYTDAALAGVPFRSSLVDEVLARGKVMAANTASAEQELQRKKVLRFVEGGPALDVLRRGGAGEPGISRALTRAQLGSPLALGIHLPEVAASDVSRDHAAAVVRAAIAYLRHGLLYCHFYAAGTSPASDRGGPIDRMFPITPVALHPGWIIGRERIVTARSGSFFIEGRQPPSIYHFASEGVRSDRQFEVRKTSGGWTLDLMLRDWIELAVIEVSELPIAQSTV